jgi:hypothetical protein
MSENSKFIVPDDFNIDEQFDRYCKLVKIDQRKVHPFQLREMRRAFYGAWGMLLIMNRDYLTEVETKHGIESACACLDHMLSQVAKFWNKEIVPGIFNEN